MKRIRLLPILLTLCCLFTSCSSFSKHTVVNIKEKHTEIFLEKPEQMVSIASGKEEKCLPEKLDVIYNSFMALMAELEQTDTLKTPFQENLVETWKKECTCIEFRYSQRRIYTGSLGKDALFSCEDLQFDAFLFVNYSGGLIAIPYIENRYVGINNVFLFLKFSETQLNNFIKII